jgi:hypothetical protein
MHALPCSVKKNEAKNNQEIIFLTHVCYYGTGNSSTLKVWISMEPQPHEPSTLTSTGTREELEATTPLIARLLFGLCFSSIRSSALQIIQAEIP